MAYDAHDDGKWGGSWCGSLCEEFDRLTRGRLKQHAAPRNQIQPVRGHHNQLARHSHTQQEAQPSHMRQSQAVRIDAARWDSTQAADGWDNRPADQVAAPAWCMAPLLAKRMATQAEADTASEHRVVDARASRTASWAEARLYTGECSARPLTQSQKVLVLE